MKLENEILGARAENLKLNQKLKVLQAINGTMKLNNLLKVQRPPHIRFGLGYETGESSKVAPPEKTTAPPKFVKQTATPSKAVKPTVQPKKEAIHVKSNRPFKKQRKFSSYGYCFHCNRYGHKIAECILYVKPSMTATGNPFSVLSSHNIECHKCHNFGHLARDSGLHIGHRFQVEKKSKLVKVRREKKRAEEPNESFSVQTAFNAQKKTAPWILDSGCSSHMTGDKAEFTKLQHFEGGSVKFGNNDGAEICGKGAVQPKEGKIGSEEVLYVSGLKHNLLSVSQICDKGHEVILHREWVRNQEV